MIYIQYQPHKTLISDCKHYGGDILCINALISNWKPERHCGRSFCSDNWDRACCMTDVIHSHFWMQHSQYVLLGLLFICRKRSQTRKPLWARRKCSSTSTKKEAMPISAGRPESMPSWDGTQWLAFQAGVKFSSSAGHRRRESLVYSCYLPSVHKKKTSFPDHTKCHRILNKPFL